MLETSPIEGELVTPEFDEAHEGESSQGEEEGQKDRSEKTINHCCKILRVRRTEMHRFSMEKRCKGI